MFTCSACVYRAFRNLARDVSPSSASIVSQDLIIWQSRQTTISGKDRPRIGYRQTLFQHRSHATLASLSTGHHRRGLVSLNRKSKKNQAKLLVNRRRKAPGAFSNIEIKDALARDKNKAWLRNETHEQDEDDGEADQDEENDGGEDLVRPSELREPTKYEEKAAQKTKSNDRELRRQELKLIRKDEKEVEIYYKDPLQLASGVLQRLRAADIDGALRLVRASESFDIKNVVSWNHCMDWLMGQGDIKAAVKVYNEMKKRQHKPDAHTYTIMLRGLSQHVHKSNAVQDAVKIYNSIFAPNSAVTPNTIHTNAIINVCARGGDMDSLWAVTGRLPEKGPGSPDRVTYTLIFNAIRENTIREVARTAGKVDFHGDVEAAADARRKMFETAVANGRKLWEDVSYKWRRADLIIDEQLVCAMGRLLLGCGIDKDIEQVLDLVETTMNLRIAGRKGKITPPLPSEDVSHPGLEMPPHTDDSVSFVPADLAGSLPLKKSNVYAVPGPKTLSMLMEAAYLHKPIRHLASSYWGVLTDPNGLYNLQPDAANITSYLRILRLNRASQKAYDLMSQEWSDDISKTLYRRGTFIIAFAACARDKNNPNVFKTAQKLLSLMQEKLEENELGMFDQASKLSELHGKQRKEALKKQRAATRNMTDEELEEWQRQKEGMQSLAIGPKVLGYFIQLAIDTTKGWNEGIRGKDDGEIFEREVAKNHILTALKIVTPHTNQLKRLSKAKLDELQYNSRGRLSNDPRKGLGVAENIDEMLDLIRIMIGAYDKVIDIADRFQRIGKEPIPSDLVHSYNSRKREYTAYIAKIDKGVARKVQDAQAFLDEKDTVDLDAEEDDNAYSSQAPVIERRMISLLEGVDAKILRERAQNKGRQPSAYLPTASLKMHSRRQVKERLNLVDKEMQRNFPQSDYGVLNEDLEIQTGAASKARIEARDRVRHRSSMGNLTGDDTSQLDRIPPTQRQPQIGDELGLDDSDDDGHYQDSRITGSDELATGKNSVARDYVPFEKANESDTTVQHGNTPSILEREDVRTAFKRVKSAEASA